METLGTFKIAEPCHANWNEMSAETQGRFCSACQRCVVDFTNKSKSEVKQIFDQEGGDVCGRLQISQLQQTRPAVRAKFNLRSRMLKPIQIFALAMFAAFTFILHAPTQAQTQEPIRMGKIAYVPRTSQVEGKVKWSSASAAPSVKVQILKGGILIAEATTDEHGKFSFSDLRAGDYELNASTEYGVSARSTVVLIQDKTTKTEIFLNDRHIMGGLAYIPKEPQNLIEKQPLIVKEEPKEAITQITKIDPLQPESASDMIQEWTIGDIGASPDESIIFGGFEVKVFPNPTIDKVTLHIEKAGNQTLDVQLVDIDGKVVFSGKWVRFMESNKIIDLSSLPAGIYLLNLVAGEESIQRRLLKL